MEVLEGEFGIVESIRRLYQKLQQMLSLLKK